MLINTHDISNLARISLTEEEHVSYGKDMESILAFVETIQSLSVTDIGYIHSDGLAPVGVVRDDQNLLRSEEYSALDIVAQAPATERNFIKVKQILNQ